IEKQEAPSGARSRSPFSGWLLLAAAVLVLAAGWYGVGQLSRTSAPVSPAAIADAPPGLIQKVESLYHDIYLSRPPDGYLRLSFGAKRLRSVESMVAPSDELVLPVEYTRSMTEAALSYAPSLDKAAIIGLGGGRTAWYLHKSVPDL